MIKQFLLILVLIFSLQSWIKADDIKDFEIEGMSIGDSLLDYVNENEINNNKIFRYNSNKYLQYNLELNNSQYDDLVIEFKNSGNYLIGSIIARIMYLDNDFYKCSSKEKVILSDLNNFFKKDADYIDHGIDKHEADKTGKSKGTWHTFQLKDGSGWIYLECMNWSDKFNSDGFVDELKITIFGTDFGNFLTNEAYK